MLGIELRGAVRAGLPAGRPSPSSTTASAARSPPTSDPPRSSPFTSKYDYWLKGQAKLTGQEQRGLELFNGKAKCANCHNGPCFTDFTYDNLGVPTQPGQPVLQRAGLEPRRRGLGRHGPGRLPQGRGVSPRRSTWPEWGKQKVPTLRNVALAPDKKFVKAYGHNGYFKSLEEIVHFYNTRDVAGAGWPPPEVAANVNTTELGNLGLNRARSWRSSPS